jgi:tetratricopeptide (TPR) repeat protein
MTRDRRALLVLDDLHWAASPTLLLLRHLIRSERPLGALVLCTYRDTELDVGQALAQLFADLQRDGSAERVSVGGLDGGAIAALVEAAVGHALPERAELVQLLGAQTAGNPFFLRELLADLAEAGQIPSAGERTAARVSTVLLQPPAGLRHVIGHRVARLSAQAGRALSVASVAGGRFSFVLLERVLGEGSGVLDALDEAVAAGLLTEAGHGDYAFAHALVRQTIYGQLGGGRRVRLHRQVGEALETLVDADAHVEALAHHFAQAAADGQGAKAAAYALAAGHHATARLGFEDAAAHYEQGLQALMLMRQRPDARCCELLLALGEARWGAGEPDKAREACHHAAELADELGDAVALARAALGAFGPYRAEEAAAARRPVIDLLQRALAALDDDDSALRAQLLGRLAATVVHTEVGHDTTLMACQALQMARRVADRTTLADVLASILLTTHGPDTLHDSLATARELARVAGEIGDGRLRARAHRWLLDFLLELGDIDGVERELQALQRLAEARRERWVTWLLTVFRANHAQLRGDLEEFETLAHEALARRFDGRDEPASHIFGAQMFFLRDAQGSLDAVVGAVEGFVAQYPAIASWRCALAYVYARLGRSALARDELEALARADFCDLPRDRFWLLNLSVICEAVVLLGDAARARLLYDLLLPYADRCVVSAGLLCRGSASRPLGLLATTLSRHDEAARHLDQALRMNTQIRSPLWTAQTQHDYARMLLLRNSLGDRDKARELLTQALTTADRLGLKGLADTARRLELTAAAMSNRPRRVA